MIQTGEDFWNFRGSHKIAGLIDVGTQFSLVRRAGGKFVLLDAYSFNDRIADQVADLTFGGTAIEAIINLHPFHTLHAEFVHTCFPEATLYGTERHKQRLPNLPWQELTTDQPEFHALYSSDLMFSVPQGVDFISKNSSVHFSSVLAYHPRSRTIHSNDTFNYFPDKGLVHFTPLADTVSFHPTLAKALQKRPGAAAEFRVWAETLFGRWSEAENLCAAHNGVLLATENEGDALPERLAAALEKVEETLSKHEEKYG